MVLETSPLTARYNDTVSSERVIEDFFRDGKFSEPEIKPEPKTELYRIRIVYADGDCVSLEFKTTSHEEAYKVNNALHTKLIKSSSLVRVTA